MWFRPSIRRARQLILAAIAVELVAGHGFVAAPAPGGAEPAERLPAHLPETALGAGESRFFAVDLKAGEALEVVVTQNDVDLALHIHDPDGTERMKIDGPYAERGEERAFFTSETGGRHTVEISAPEDGGGTFSLRSLLQPVTDANRPRLEIARVQAQGDRLRREGELEAAKDAYRRAAELARREGDARAESLALHRLGWRFRAEGSTAEALAAYRGAAAALERAERREELRDITADLAFGSAVLALALGDPDAAISDFERAADLYEELGDLDRQARAVNESARALERHGRLDDARRAYERALDLARRLGDLGLEGAIINNLGGTYLRLGHHELALDRFAEALTLRRQTGDRVAEGLTLIRRGTAERRLGRLDNAHASFLEAWRLLREEERLVWTAYALNGLGLTELEREDFDRAERALRSALTIFRQDRRRRPEANVLLNLGELALAQNEAETTRRLAEEALRLFDALADRQGQASAYFARARAERRLGHLAVAERLNRVAIELVESLRRGAVVDPLRMAYLAQRREYYEHATDLRVALHRRSGAEEETSVDWLAEALAMSERGRARSLLESLAISRDDSAETLDPELRKREDEAVERLIDLERERVRLDVREASRKRREDVERQLRLAALELAEIRQKLRRADPDDADLVRPRPFDVDRFRREELNEKTVLLVLSLGEDRGHLFWIDREKVEVYPLPGRSRLDRLARLAHEALQDSHKPSAADQARRMTRELSRVILEPVAHHLDGQRLVVVAEGALHYVPFAVLPDPRHLDEAEPPLLLEHHEIVSLPSASVLEALRRPPTRRPATKTLAAVADPVFTPADPRLDGHLPASAATRDLDQRLDRLPYTAEEVEAILELLPEDEGFSAIGFDAHVELLESGRLAEYRILHIASHGRFDAEYPELSGLELSRFTAAGEPRQGTLYAHQIYDLPLNAELVVLSACRTALGRELRGEGLVGLTRSFFHTGAKRVVVSLWGVDDQATTELMSRFYRHLLRDDLPPAAALRAAQRELRAEPRWSAPYYWAAFILQGDWR